MVPITFPKIYNIEGNEISFTRYGIVLNENNGGSITGVKVRYNDISQTRLGNIRDETNGKNLIVLNNLS